MRASLLSKGEESWIFSDWLNLTLTTRTAMASRDKKVDQPGNGAGETQGLKFDGDDIYRSQPLPPW